MATRKTVAPRTSEDQVIADLVADLMQRLEAGEAIDLDRFALEHPECADELRRLLPAMEVLVSLSKSGVSGAASAIPVAEEAERILGDYRIVREIGRGGMGVVYEAEQISLARRVALKVLPFASLLDPRQIQRFKNEAQAAAQLHHTNIVPVYSVGVERGVHYYAMQYIDGQALDEVICELRQLSGLDAARSQESTPSHPERKTPLAMEGSIRSGAFFRSVARLGVQAAEALDHAHNLGVIHRDIKPSNLLLDVHGNIWITDFGLARCRQSDTGLTVTGDVLGTLRYMSPEQALARRGLVDHRTDIYSLGVTIYEILTLEPALSGRDREELLHQITFEDPRHARKLNPAIPPELETIVGKAMAKEPESRYATAQDLADDLSRFLENRPILARRPTVPQRARKWSRRHRTLVGAGAVLLVLATVGMVLGTALIWKEKERTKGALTQANENLQEAKEQADRAVRNYQLAHDAVAKLLTRVAEEQLLNVPRMESVRKALLEEALRFYQEFLKERGEDPKVRQETALAYGRVGFISGLLGQHEEAERGYRKKIEMLEQLASESLREPNHRRELADAYDNLAHELSLKTDVQAAYDAWDRAISIQEALAAEFPEEPVYSHNLSGCLGRKGFYLVSHGRYAEAEEVLLRSKAKAERLSSEWRDDLRYKEASGVASGELGYLYNRLSRFREAEERFRETLALFEDLMARKPGTWNYRRQVAVSHLNLGGVLPAIGRHAEGQASIERALPIFRGLAADFPLIPERRTELAEGISRLALVFQEEGKLKEAREARLESVAHWEDLVRGFPDVGAYRDALASAYANLGNIQSVMDPPETAEKTYRRALEIKEKLAEDFSKNPTYRNELARSHNNLGIHLQDFMGKVQEAEAEYRAALDLYERLAEEFPGQPDHRAGVADSLNNLGSVFLVTNRQDEAERVWRRAVDIRRRLSAEHPQVAEYRRGIENACNNLAIIVAEARRFEEAEALLATAREEAERLTEDSPTNPEYAHDLSSTLQNWALVKSHQGDHAGGLQLMEESISQVRKALALNPGNRKFSFALLGCIAERIGILADAGRHAEAANGATAFLQESHETGDLLAQVASAMAHCAAVAEKDGEVAEAERPALSQSYADLAMRLLRASVEKGFRDGERIEKDPELDPLRGREDFQALLKEIREETVKTETKAE